MRYDATDIHQIVRIENPGWDATYIAGTAKRKRRENELKSEGNVLPNPWNTAEQANINPDATKFHAMIFRYSLPKAMVDASLVKIVTSASGLMWLRKVLTSIRTVANVADTLNA